MGSSDTCFIKPVFCEVSCHGGQEVGWGSRGASVIPAGSPAGLSTVWVTAGWAYAFFSVRCLENGKEIYLVSPRSGY